MATTAYHHTSPVAEGAAATLCLSLLRKATGFTWEDSDVRRRLERLVLGIACRLLSSHTWLAPGLGSLEFWTQLLT